MYVFCFHYLVILHVNLITNYLSRMHIEDLKHLDQRLERNETLLLNKHIETFPQWLVEKIRSSRDNVTDSLKWLSQRPRLQAMSYMGCIINGHRFHTRDVEKSTQNSGITLDADTVCRSSVRDTSQVVGRVSCFGVIKDIILLNYYIF